MAYASSSNTNHTCGSSTTNLSEDTDMRDMKDDKIVYETALDESDPERTLLALNYQENPLPKLTWEYVQAKGK